jgi:hypothetical protein
MNRVEKKQPAPFYSTGHLARPSASQLIAEAKASLSRPSRPFTPHPRARPLKAVPQEDIAELAQILEPIAPIGPKKTSTRVVRFKPCDKLDKSEDLPTFSPKLSSEEQIFTIPNWKEYLHYIEPIERVNFEPARIQTQDDEHARSIKSSIQKKMALEAFEAIKECNDSRRVQELAVVALQFDSVDSQRDAILEILYDISCDDIQIPTKGYVEELLRQLDVVSWSQKILIFGIMKHLSDSLLAHDVLIESNLLKIVGAHFVSLKHDDPFQESRAMIDCICCMYNIVATNECFHLVDSRIVEKLCEIIDINSHHYANFPLGLVTYKLLAVFSEHTSFLGILSKSSTIMSLFDRMIDCSQEPRESASLLLRIFYILGNLSSAKVLEPNFILDTLDDVIALFGIVFEELRGESKQFQDLTLKMIRYIANIALLPEVGKMMKHMLEMHDLFKFLDSEDDEIQLNTISCLANLSYYIEPCDIMYNEFINYSKRTLL